LACGFGGEFVVVATKILRERESGDDDGGVRSVRRPRMGRSRCLRRAVVGFDPLVGVPLEVVPGCRYELVEDSG
jgi:hypothetical protein